MCNKNSLFFLASCFAVGLTGCAKPQVVVKSEPDIVEQRLMASADKIHNDANRIAKTIEYQKKALSKPLMASPKNGPLAQKISLQWNGEAEPVIRAVSKMIGFSFRVSGARRGSPVMVVVRANQRKAFDVLEDIGLQLGAKTGIRINEKQKIVQLVYLP